MTIQLSSNLSQLIRDKKLGSSFNVQSVSDEELVVLNKVFEHQHSSKRVTSPQIYWN